MDAIFSLMNPTELALALCIGVFAGFVKGVVGFALPLLLLSGLTVFLPPEIALAGLILPTLITNGFQALRHGWVAALSSVRKFRVYLTVGGICLLLSAQFVRTVPETSMLLAIGVLVTLSSMLLLSGFRFRVTRHKTAIEAVIAMIAGSFGGISATWGPPTVAYLTAIDTPKQDQMRVQGVIYGLGAICLTVAHVYSGVLRVETVGFSAVMILPVIVGSMLGTRVVDVIAQDQFRRTTLFVLLIAGLNLMRRGLWG